MPKHLYHTCHTFCRPNADALQTAGSNRVTPGPRQSRPSETLPQPNHQIAPIRRIHKRDAALPARDVEQHTLNFAFQIRAARHLNSRPFRALMSAAGVVQTVNGRGRISTLCQRHKGSD